MNKLVDIERETSEEKGAYALFALFLREDASDKWDILVTANWIDKNKEESLKYLAQKIQNSLTQSELVQISRIVIIEENNSSLPALQQAINIEHGAAEIKDSTFFGTQVKHAFLITSKRQQAA